jgi:hypothetical protein
MAGAGDLGIVDDLLAFGFDGTTPTTSWWWLAVGSPHAGTPLDLLGTVGGAVALLGAMLLLGHIGQPVLRRVIDFVTAPLAAAGAMTLTLYTAHVVFMNSQLEVFEPTTAYIIQVVAVLLVGVIWRQAVGRGPLEAAASAVSARSRALVDGPGPEPARFGNSVVAGGSVTTPNVMTLPFGTQPSTTELWTRERSETELSRPALSNTAGPVTQPSMTDRSVIDPAGRPLSLHGPVLSRSMPASGSKRLPGPFVARPPRRAEGVHRRPAPGRPER